MKKLYSLFIILLMIVTLTGCGNEENDTVKASIYGIVTNNSEEVESLSATDLRSIKNENSANYNNEYYLAQIETYGTVERVSGYTSLDNDTTLYDIIYFNEGWMLCLEQGKYDLINDLRSGDIVYAKASIMSEFGEYIRLDYATVLINATDKTKSEVDEQILVIEEKNKLVEFLEDINQEYEFISKYVNNEPWGQESINQFEKDLIMVWDTFDINLDVLNEEIPNIKTIIEEVKTDCSSALEYITKRTNNGSKENKDHLYEKSKEYFNKIRDLIEKLESII